jgi:hypothetical protein
MDIYLISRIHSNSHAHHEALCNELKTHAFIKSIFIPFKWNPWTILPNEIELEVFLQDLQEMKKCTLGIISFPFGKDCSAEIGWFYGSSKKTVGILWDSGYGPSCMEQYESISMDWMVKGFIHQLIVIGCEKTYQKIQQDSILKNKVLFIQSFDQLNLNA